MSYEQVAAITQTTALLIFIVMSVLVLVYVFWPGNRERFEAAQKAALDLESEDDCGEDRS